MTQFQLAFDFSAPAEPVLLGLDAETIEALANDSRPEISIPEIIAGITVRFREACVTPDSTCC